MNVRLNLALIAAAIAVANAAAIKATAKLAAREEHSPFSEPEGYPPASADSAWQKRNDELDLKPRSTTELQDRPEKRAEYGTVPTGLTCHENAQCASNTCVFANGDTKVCI